MSYPIPGSAKFGKWVYRHIEYLERQAMIVWWMNPPHSKGDGQVLLDCAQIMREMYAEIARLREHDNPG
jgi:hypothetical protein